MTNVLNKFLINAPEEVNSNDFDLQSHTIFSDGKNTPADLINSAVVKGLKLISITDHNSIASYTEENFQLAKQNGVSLIPGVEIECGGGLDVLVYDNVENSISEEYREKISALVNELNKTRSGYVSDSINKIVEFLKNSDQIVWMNWKNKTEEEKDKILKHITLENASRVDLRTGRILETKRDYVSKPHLGMLLAPFNLINLEAFAEKFGIPIEQAPKFALGYIFDKVVPWPLDSLPINEEIVKKVVELPFIKIMAHPGKTFEDKFEENQISESNFIDFLNSYLEKGLDGAEGDYRRYKKPKLEYNQLTKKVLVDSQRRSSRDLYATGGSDTHDIFE